MSLRGLIVLTVLLAAVAGALVWLERTKPPPAAPVLEAPLMPPFREDAVAELAASCEASTWTLRHVEPAGWRIAAPFEAEADPRRVHDVIAGLQDARAHKVVADAGTDPAAFGLQPSGCSIRVTVSAESVPRTLRLGRTSPLGADRYALDQGGKVVLTDGSLFSLIAREPASFRERRLIPVEPGAVTRIGLDRPAGRLVLEKADGSWRVTEPFRDAASEEGCLALARTIAGLAVGSAPVGVAPPVAARADRRIAIDVATAQAVKPPSAFVAVAGVGGQRYAWRAGGSPSGLLPETTARDLEQTADAFRDKSVTSMSAPSVRWVVVERGGARLRVERAAQGAWTGRDGTTPFPVDGARVEALLDRLSRLTAAGFDAAPSVSTASGTIVLGGDAGELARLSWGPEAPEPGRHDESVWVTTPARPGVAFRVLATEFGPIPSKVSEWGARS